MYIIIKCKRRRKLKSLYLTSFFYFMLVVCISVCCNFTRRVHMLTNVANHIFNIFSRISSKFWFLRFPWRLFPDSRIEGWKFHPGFRLEKCVRKGDIVRVLQERIIYIIRINVEEHRHIHLKTIPLSRKCNKKSSGTSFN